MIKNFSKNIIVFIVTFVVCAGALLAVCQIPQSAIYENSRASSEYFTDNAGFPVQIKGHANTRIDNYADCILFNVIYNMDEQQAMKSIIAAPYYRIEGNDAREDFASAVIDGKEPNNEYSRYWHGSQVLIRPLLLMASVEQIRLILFGLLIALNIVLAVLLLRHRQYTPATIYFAALILVQFWMCAFTIEYVMSFLVMSTVCIVVTVIWSKGAAGERDADKDALRGSTASQRRMTYIFIVSGAVTCFVDFLTSETLTFTVPFVLYVMLCRKGGAGGSHGVGTNAFRAQLCRLIKWGAGWLSSYAAMFGIKWVLVYGVLGKSAFFNVLESAAYRIEGAVALDNAKALAGEAVSAGQRVFLGLLRNIACLFPTSDQMSAGAVAGIALGILVVLAVVLYLFRGERIDGTFIAILLLVAAIPYLRYLCLSNHSFIHYFFTYRAQMATIMALATIMIYNLKPSYILRKQDAGSSAGNKPRPAKKTGKNTKKKKR